MPTPYTSKIRAKRIELDYFKRPHPFRRLKLGLTIAAAALAALWLGYAAVRGDQRIYNSGPLSTGHAMFDVQCAQCHVPEAKVAAAGAPAPGQGAFWLRVSDRSCLTCHDGPVHHEAQTFDSACTTCHVEHKGHVVLASISSRHCTQCHADLKTKGGTSPYVATIGSFATSHPEFAVTVKGPTGSARVRLDDKPRLKDTAQVKLNHEVHLRPGLRYVKELKEARGGQGIVDGPDGLQLSCTFCHRPDGQQAYMEPISYAKHCGPVCHGLDFDARLPDSVVAPHDSPAIVHAFLRTLYGEAFEACQPLGKPGATASPDVETRCRELGLLKAAAKADAREDDGRPRARVGQREETAEEDRPRARVGRREEPAEEDRPRARVGRREEPAEEDRPRARVGRGEPEAKPASAPAVAAWVPEQIAKAESGLFKKKCAECHVSAETSRALPELLPTAIPTRWFPHSRFDHGMHRPLACAECHGAALKSIDTADVLLPGKAVCQQCHRESGGARAGCVECHVYHDKAKARDQNGPLKIRQLTGVGATGTR